MESLVMVDPILHLPFDDLLPRTALIPDMSAYRRCVTLIGSAGLSSVQSKFGGKSLRGASSSGVKGSHNGDLNVGTGDFTLMMWLYLVAKTTAYPSLFINSNEWAPGSMRIYAGHAGADATKYQVYLNERAQPLQSTGSIVYGDWVHFSLICALGSMTIYLNGEASGTISSSIRISRPENEFAIGVEIANPLNTWVDAYFDDFAFYPSALYSSNFTPPGKIAYTALSAPSGSLMADVKHLSNYPVPNPGLGRIDSIGGSRDLYDGGVGRIIGTVKKKNTPDNLPLQRRVRLHKSRDGRPLAETWSNAAGFYEFRNIDPAGNYYTASFDHLGNFRGVIADNLTPEIM